MTQEKLHGLLVLDKPSGITSRDAVNAAQRLFPRKTKIGHAGTLDPLATGVLVLCVGQATRLIEYVQQMNKEYETEIVFGATSDTDDADGNISERSGVQLPDRQSLVEALTHFEGEVKQIPPQFSAAKVDGQRAYRLARESRSVNLEERTVRVDAIQLLHFQPSRARLRIQCGKGTYIRAIARDLGEKLDCGGYVHTLRRTRIGHFRAEDALDLNDYSKDILPQLLPLTEGIRDLPRLKVDEVEARRLRHGQILHLSQPLASGQDHSIFQDCELVGLGQVGTDGITFKPTKILAQP
ncbi:MAG: tRNA pseudouridine(55) synthase TruB [Gemmataceae bacterium]